MNNMRVSSIRCKNKRCEGNLMACHLLSADVNGKDGVIYTYILHCNKCGKEKVMKSKVTEYNKVTKISNKFNATNVSQDIRDKYEKETLDALGTPHKIEKLEGDEVYKLYFGKKNFIEIHPESGWSKGMSEECMKYKLNALHRHIGLCNLLEKWEKKDITNKQSYK